MLYETKAPHMPGELGTLIFAGQLMTGNSVSNTITLKLQSEVFPQASVAVAETVVVPTAKKEPGAMLYTTVALPEQISLAETE